MIGSWRSKPPYVLDLPDENEPLVLFPDLEDMAFPQPRERTSMPSFDHRKLKEKILALDTPPSDTEAFRQWVKAGAHLSFLKANAQANEVVIYGSGPYSFIHSIVVPDDQLDGAADDDLLCWSCNPYTSIASYVSGGGRKSMWVERGGHDRGSKLLNTGKDLIFVRTFEGWSGAGGTYVELNQEYAHLTGIHWRPEEQAYCRFDGNGDLRHVVSSTIRDGTNISLVTFTWEELEEYLSISNQALIRLYDFTLLKREQFVAWPDIDEEIHRESGELFYRQRGSADATYTRGVQIIRPRRTIAEVSKDVTNEWSGRRQKQYAEFLAHDWRNKCLTRISTDPTATTNYFEAEGNDKPFELSPAFFRPEVLSKYKTDREKYTLKEREVSCRSAWHLPGYDVNEAGQIHAYICDLRQLPYSEQLYWQSFNVEPKTGISGRAFVNDFQGEFVTFSHPREQIMSIARSWEERSVSWWKLRDPELLNRANVPLTSSKDEWSEAIMDIAKVVIEGFDTNAIRRQLKQVGATYEQKDGTITLLEKLLNFGRHIDDPVRLDSLREAWDIRSKIGGHTRGTQAQQIMQDAVSEHGSFPEHFTKLCKRISAELVAIGLIFEGGTAD
jgi:hypothetical protein